MKIILSIKNGQGRDVRETLSEKFLNFLSAASLNCIKNPRCVLFFCIPNWISRLKQVRRKEKLNAKIISGYINQPVFLEGMHCMSWKRLAYLFLLLLLNSYLEAWHPGHHSKVLRRINNQRESSSCIITMGRKDCSVLVSFRLCLVFLLEYLVWHSLCIHTIDWSNLP